jgi:ligand-binding SRPBCC domain-containing protein
MHDRLFDRVLAALSTGERPAGGIRVLHVETVVPVPVDEAFAFFASAANLERLTPPWVKFRIRTPLPIEMRAGTLIDYDIVLHGVPLPWRTQIDVWEPGVRFVDRQLAGPYWWWRHEHRFEPADGGTRVIDEVEYAPRLPWVTSAMVARDVGRIFVFRQRALRAQWLDASPL